MDLTSHFALLLDLLLKSAALILLGASLLTALRKTSAANRHAVSAAIFAALLLLPFTKLMPPRWSFALEKKPESAVSVRLPLIATVQTPVEHAAVAPVENIALPVPRTVRAPLVIPWKTLALAVWLGGAAWLLARRALIALKLRAVVRRSDVIEDGRLATMARELVETSGVRTEVRQSALCRVPIVVGVTRPVVLLPADAQDWNDALISSALRHELGHIRRRDCITRLLADVLCALYWINPLVWFAARQMRLAQEQACDDLVLNSGARADEYAGQLVDVVRSLQGDHFTARHALAMAQPSTLETRVLAIVDATRDRSPRSVRGALAGVAFTAAALAFCTAAQLRGAEEKKSSPAVAPAGPQVQIEAKFIEITGDDPALSDFLKEPNLKPVPADRGAISAAGESTAVAGTKGAVPDLQKKAAQENAPAIHGVLAKEKADAVFKALKDAKGVDVLSTPRVTTFSKQQAKIEIIREMRYATEWDKDGKTGDWKPKTFDTKNVGVTFGVTPEVKADGTISLRLVPQVVEFGGFIDLDADPHKVVAMPDASKPFADRLAVAPSAKGIPGSHRAQAIFHTRNIDTQMTVKASDTIVLEGLGVGGAVGGKKELQRRLIVLVTASIAGPEGVPAEKPEKAGDTAAAEVTPKKAASEITLPKVEFRDATLREALDFLVAKSKDLDPAGKGVNIVLKNAEKIGDTKITLRLSDLPLAAALRYVAGLANCEVVKEEFAYVVQPEGEGAKPVTEQKAVFYETAPVSKLFGEGAKPVIEQTAPEKEPAAPAAAGPKGAALKKADTIVFPKIELKDATLSETVDFLRMKAKELDPGKQGVNLILMPFADRDPFAIPLAAPLAAPLAERKAPRITLSLTDIPLSQALRYVAQLAGYEVVADDFAITLRPAAE